MHFHLTFAAGALALLVNQVNGQAAAGAAGAAGAGAAGAAGAGAAGAAGAGAAGAGGAGAAGAAGAAAPAPAAAPAAAAPAAGGAVGAGGLPVGGSDPIPQPSALQSSSPSTGKFPSLTGTWTTNSYKVFTGPGFYDPINEKFTEPPITGISYSFTDDGYYEEAFYRAISNPTTPSCPSGLIQWQHGSYQVNSNGSISLSPIAVDGRQQNSNPCAYSVSSYERYYQPELFAKYEVVLDRYHNVWRLNLYQFNGVPMNPMYLAYQPPQMLPTITINPTGTQTGAAATSSATSTGTSSKKRSIDFEKTPLGKQAIRTVAWMNPEKMWYAGLGMVGLGSFLYLAF